jgi:hypothetical protein
MPCVAASSMPAVLVLGGAGVFGRRICCRLAREKGIRLIVGGRTATKARSVAAALEGGGAIVEACALDAPRDLPRRLGADPAIRLVIHTAGPFEGQGYAVAEAAIAAGVHYVDLADGRRFVCDIVRLDEAARRAGVLVVAGASSVPGLSGAAIATLRRHFRRVDEIAIGIVPGNRVTLGAAAVATVLGFVGKEVPVWRDGRWRHAIGWQGLHRRRVTCPGAAPLPPRWLALCDVPDLELWPMRDPTLRRVTFAAGLDLAVLHLGLWALSWPVRIGVLSGLERFAPFLTRIAASLERFGSDRGAMFVELAGEGRDGAPLRQLWRLIAGSGHGPCIPALPAVVVARKLLRGTLDRRGATPCIDLFELAEIEAECRDLDIVSAIA